MFVSHSHIPNSNSPHDTQPAIEIERYVNSWLDSSEHPLQRFIEFLRRWFEVEEREQVDGGVALILFEKVQLRVYGGELLLVCKTEKVRDRILAELLEHRVEWARELGPERWAQRQQFWTDRHREELGSALKPIALVIGIQVLLFAGLYGREEVEEVAGIMLLVVVAIIPPSYRILRATWTLLRCRSGAIEIPEQLELTELELLGFLREEALWGPRIGCIELDAIQKLWFLTVEPWGDSGTKRRKVRWRYRFDTFGVLMSDQEIRGLRIRAGGRTYRIWADRFEREGGDGAIRDLCKALQQRVRESLFPVRAS